MPFDGPTKTTLQRFLMLLRRSQTSLLAFTLPTLYALLASLGEGFTLIFLIPTIKGMIDVNYHPIHSIPVSIVRLFPELAVYSKSTAILLFLSATFIAALAKVLFSYLAGLETARHLKLFAARLRTVLYSRYLSFGKIFFDRSNIGQLQQTITTYVSFTSASLGTIQNSFYAATTLVVYLTIMFYISAQLTTIVLLAFPILHFSLRWLIRRIDLVSKSHATTYNELVKDISNSLSTIALVKAYSNEDADQERFSRMSHEVAKLEYNIERNTLLIAPVQELIVLSFLILLVALVALFFSAGNPASIAKYAVYFVILKRSAGLFSVFSSISAALASVSGAIEKMADIMSDEDKYYVPSGNVKFTGINGSIDFRNLQFRYPDGITALKNLTFSIKRGQTVAAVGQSGSGKSTLIHLLMRFYDCDPGSILVDGIDIREFSIESWRERIALVSQSTLLINATLKENLVYGLVRAVGTEELQTVLEQARLMDFVEQLPRGLDTEIGDHGVKLSGGERQRVSIARAILKDADILLLDEATSALDSLTEKLVQQALEDLTRDKTTLIVAHRLSTIKSADHVIVLEKGEIVEQGSLQELVNNKGALAAYWKEQRL